MRGGWENITTPNTCSDLVENMVLLSILALVQNKTHTCGESPSSEPPRFPGNLTLSIRCFDFVFRRRNHWIHCVGLSLLSRLGAHSSSTDYWLLLSDQKVTMGKSKGTSSTDSKPMKTAVAPVVEKAKCKGSKSVKPTGATAKAESIVTKKAKVSAEIDDLFCSVAKKATKKSAEPDSEVEPAEPVKAKHRSSKETTYGVMKSTYGGDIVNPEAPLERIDAESGLPVYKAHLLKVGEGGGTEYCPFDCNCCF